uniref:Uncharacterized protein n=1 Tax=Anguilla anguilla TaxID=7936 RepID=A0A0E9RK90_ANGAN
MPPVCSLRLRKRLTHVTGTFWQFIGECPISSTFTALMK